MSVAFIILPNQLFKNISKNKAFNDSKFIYLIEHDFFFIKFKFHKMKLILHRASMKAYYDYLISISQNKNIIYIESHNAKSEFKNIFTKHNFIHIYDPIDYQIMNQFNKLTNINNINLIIHHNLLFIETNQELDEYYNNLKSHSHFIHDNGFYIWQRKRLNILMKNDKPLFDQLSFDHDNRKNFDKSYICLLYTSDAADD
jgi:deoxyribodipyrimidine photolyase-related protein